MYLAAFDNVVKALQVLDAVQRLGRDEMAGWCDAAVVDKTIFGAIRVMKFFVDATADELADELREALKG